MINDIAEDTFFSFSFNVVHWTHHLCYLNGKKKCNIKSRSEEKKTNYNITDEKNIL
jgi:hypothetical protein